MDSTFNYCLTGAPVSLSGRNSRDELGIQRGKIMRQSCRGIVALILAFALDVPEALVLQTSLD